MSVKRQIILIPYWVQDVLRRKQLPLSTVLDLQALRPVMSLSDIASLLAAQECWHQLSGIKEPCAGSLVMQWFRTTGVGGSESNNFLSHTVLPLSSDVSVRKELQARLFEGSARLEQEKDAFISYDLSPEFSGVVVNPGFFGSHTDKKLAKAFVSAMLKVLYVYEPHHEVAKTPLFRRYLSLLPA